MQTFLILSINYCSINYSDFAYNIKNEIDHLFAVHITIRRSLGLGLVLYHDSQPFAVMCTANSEVSSVHACAFHGMDTFKRSLRHEEYVSRYYVNLTHYYMYEVNNKPADFAQYITYVCNSIVDTQYIFKEWQKFKYTLAY